MRFELYAPTTEAVDLIGSWSDEATPMERRPDGLFAAEIDLPDGEHRYKFRLRSRSSFANGEVVEITDPLAARVDEAMGDVSIVVVEGARDATLDYGWQHDEVPLPADRDLILYELHVGEFAAEGDEIGTFRRLAERLDELVDLGVNAIEIMPVAAFPADRSWGYNPRHAAAPENTYGTPQDLCALVDAAHARGMRVLLDLVLNHAELESPLTRIDHDLWFRIPPDGEEAYGPKFDYQRFHDGRSPARLFGLAVAQRWLHAYHLDGFRLDATRLIDNFDFLNELRALVSTNLRPALLVAEHIPEDPAVAGPDGPVHGAWHQCFQGRVADAMCAEDPDLGALADALHPANHGYARPALTVNYVESHDDHTLMRRLLESGRDPASAARRHTLAATILFTAVGIPMVHQGQEFGGHRVRSCDVRPLDRELMATPVGSALRACYQRLARIRSALPDLRSEELEIVHAGDGVLAYRRGTGVLVILNLRDQPTEVRIAVPPGKWRELLTDGERVTDGTLIEGIEPSGARILVPA